MLTDTAHAVNDASSRSDGLWLSVTELARERRISKPAISQALKRWADAGVVVSTRRDGRSLLINVAEFDLARGATADLSKLQGEQTKKDQGEGHDPIFAKEQARKAGYDADLAMLKRDEQLGRLVPVADLQDAAVRCGEAVVRIADQIVNRAEDVAAAVSKTGVTGARSVLKDVARELRQSMADEFARLPTLAMAPGQGEIGDQN